MPNGRRVPCQGPGLLSSVIASALLCSTTSPVITWAQREPTSPVQAMRNKISAGDILSAESLLEIHRQQYGEDSEYLYGLGWLARGALLVGDPERAQRYVDQVRALPELEEPSKRELRSNRELRTTLGAALEVEAQLIAERSGPEAGARFLKQEAARIPTELVALRSRLQKRANLLTLEGKPAPTWQIEDHLGEPPPTLESLRGEPVLLFLWAEWCGDCKSQANLLARARRLYEDRGLRLVTLTRYYDAADKRTEEKQRVEAVWNEAYSQVGELPIAFSTRAMERYGASSTPTYVFIDSNGRVSDYSPYRLTEAEFDLRVKEIL